MLLTHHGGMRHWKFHSLMRDGLTHLITDRHAFGPGEFTTGTGTTPEESQVGLQNRELIRTTLEVSKLWFPQQVHGSTLVEVTADTQPEDLAGTDAVVTAQLDIGIAVQSADCVPVLLYDPVHRVIGAVHAGWRGTLARIAEKTVLYMVSRYGTDPQTLLAGIGPSICQKNYEVGSEVAAAFLSAFGPEPMIPRENGKVLLDLWEVNRRQLMGAGLPPESIEIAGLCSYEFQQHFYSARRGDKGRFAACIALR